MLLAPKGEIDSSQLGTLELAFVGDGVYELLVREHLVARGAMPVKKLHQLSVGVVCAKAQSAAVEVILPLLTPQEEALYKRGRNANGIKSPKNTDFADYRRATGLETLFGWLYLSGEIPRLEELFQKILIGGLGDKQDEE